MLVVEAANLCWRNDLRTMDNGGTCCGNGRVFQLEKPVGLSNRAVKRDARDVALATAV